MRIAAVHDILCTYFSAYYQNISVNHVIIHHNIIHVNRRRSSLTATVQHYYSLIGFRIRIARVRQFRRDPATARAGQLYTIIILRIRCIL